MQSMPPYFSTKTDEKEAITDEEKDLFWSKGLMGTHTVKPLLSGRPRDLTKCPLNEGL